MEKIFPQKCIGGEECQGNKCPGAQSFTEERVFISIPYEGYPKRRESILRSTVKKVGLNPILAKETHFSSDLRRNTFMSLCSCPWAIFDLSPSRTGKSVAEGVLQEFSFGSSFLNGCLLISSRREHLGVLIGPYIVNKYTSERQLEETVHKWLLRQVIAKNDLFLIRKILTAGHYATFRSSFYCVAPHRKPRGKSRKGPNGGLAACRLIDLKLSRLLDSYRPLPHVCTEHCVPPAGSLSTVLTWIRRQSFDAEMVFLFDAPSTKEGRRKVTVNWASQAYLTHWLPQRLQQPLAYFQTLSAKEQKAHPAENTQIVFPTKIGNQRLYATTHEDIGLAIRGPHPFDPNGAVLVGAGIHAHGTYAVAVALTTPQLIRSLMHLASMKVEYREPVFFQAVLKVPRTGYTAKPERLEWLFAERLRLKK
jgi:hypothetical protein